VSYIAGVFDWVGENDSDAKTTLLERMGNVLAHRGQETIEKAVEERAGATVGGYRWGQQELVRLDLRGSTVLVAWDGVLRNRSALRKAVGDPAASVGRLVGLCLRQWGRDFCREFEGEFAFAVLFEKGLLLGRDPTGLRPLFYACEGRRILFASEIKALFQDSKLQPLPNRGMVADSLWGYITQPNETFFEKVHRLKPGCTLEITSEGRCDLRPYHRIALVDVDPLPPAISEEELRERLKETLTESLKACLARPLPAGLLLSGGLDSISILAVSDEAYRRAKKRIADLKVVSSYFGRITSSNEKPLIEATCRIYGISPDYIRSDDLWSLKDVQNAPRIRIDEPTRGQLIDAFESSQARSAAALGARLILTGYGADQVWAANLWIFHAWRERGEDERLKREFMALPQSYQEIVGALLQSEADPFAAPVLHPPFDELPSEMWELHQERVPCQDRPALSSFADVGAWGIYHSATCFEIYALAETVRGIGLEFGTEFAFPFLDPRFVELMISIPSERRIADGYVKQMARLLLQGNAPEAVIDQKEKSHLNGLVDRGLRFREKNLVQELLENEVALDLGLLSSDFCTAIHLGYLNDQDAFRGVLLNVLAVSLWSREWFG